MNIVDQYAELFKSDYQLSDATMNTHLERFELLDELLPPSSTFFMITNSINGTYEFISSNFEYATGLSKTTLEENGIPYFISLIHPEEVQNWLRIVRELMIYYMMNNDDTSLNKLEFQYNYRIKTKDNQYLNILEKQVNLMVDDKGKPIICLSHFTVFGREKNEPMTAIVRYLNKKNEYETVLRKVYGIKLLENGVSNRERDILRLLALGFTNDEVADKLFISTHTVKTHRKNMLKKCGVRNTSELLVKCIKEGII